MNCVDYGPTLLSVIAVLLMLGLIIGIKLKFLSKELEDALSWKNWHEERSNRYQTDYYDTRTKLYNTEQELKDLKAKINESKFTNAPSRD